MVVVPDRTSATLLSVIQQHVEEGSEIWHDDWAAYRSLHEHGFVHKVVNHSERFVADDGTHTQRIESQWRIAKKWARDKAARDDDEFAEYLCEYLWRRWVRLQALDPMEELFAAIRREYGDFRHQ